MNTSHTEPMHPRPQLARAGWIDLRGTWGFAYDDDERGLEEGWQDREEVFSRTVIVPFPPESPASGIGDPSFHPVLWYRRTFAVEHEGACRRVLLHFGAVDYRAHVWVNGRLVAIHEGGHTPFSADVTDVLLPGPEQTLVVRAEDRPQDLSQPRGKQDWQEIPHDIWYARTSGIWQPVWIEYVAPTHVTGLRWTPDLDRGTLAVTVTLSLHAEPVRIRLHLSLHGELLAEDVFTAQGPEVRHEITLDPGGAAMDRQKSLWSPEHPNLIDAAVGVLIDDQIVDEVSSYAGLRSVGTEGGRFLLNGRPYYLRMALEQGFWPKSHLAAPSDEALRREVTLAKQLGFNGLRIHQKVEDPRFLYWCDRLGLLVWGEMANAYVFTRSSVERVTREWVDVVNRDLSHPCIAAWVPINESWGTPDLLNDPAQQHLVRALFHLTRALDPTRPVIGNDGWEHIVGDILGIHDYTFSGDTIRERYGTAETIVKTLHEVQPSSHVILIDKSVARDVPIMVTEFGGISYKPPENDDRWYGYGTVDTQESYLEKYRELVEAVLDCPGIAGFCYTQLTDTMQETNGLLTADRRFKLEPADVTQVTRRPSASTLTRS